jgi:hypothetical protein
MKKLRPYQIVSIKEVWHWWGDNPIHWQGLYHLCVCERIDKNKYRVLKSFFTTASAFRYKKSLQYSHIKVMLFLPP